MKHEKILRRMCLLMLCAASAVTVNAHEIRDLTAQGSGDSDSGWNTYAYAGNSESGLKLQYRYKGPNEYGTRVGWRIKNETGNTYYDVSINDRSYTAEEDGKRKISKRSGELIAYRLKSGSIAYNISDSLGPDTVVLDVEFRDYKDRLIDRKEMVKFKKEKNGTKTGWGDIGRITVLGFKSKSD